MLKRKGKTCMVEEPSHVKQLSLNHVCKIGLNHAENLFTDHRFLQEHHEHRGDISCLAPRPSAESQGHHLKRITKKKYFPYTTL